MRALRPAVSYAGFVALFGVGSTAIGVLGTSASSDNMSDKVRANPGLYRVVEIDTHLKVLQHQHAGSSLEYKALTDERGTLLAETGMSADYTSWQGYSTTRSACSAIMIGGLIFMTAGMAAVFSYAAQGNLVEDRSLAAGPAGQPTTPSSS